MTRQCARPGCSKPAVATLTYDYGNQSAWLDRLHAEAHPMTHDLCEAHAARLSVPQGWALEDRRTVAPFASALATPAAIELDDEFRSQLAS